MKKSKEEYGFKNPNFIFISQVNSKNIKIYVLKGDSWIDFSNFLKTWPYIGTTKSYSFLYLSSNYLEGNFIKTYSKEDVAKFFLIKLKRCKFFIY